MSGVSAGHETRVHYLQEDNGFAQSPTDSNPKNPGADTQLTTTEGSNAVQRVFRPGKRTAVDLIAMVFQGSFALNFTLVNPWWLMGAFGSPSQTDNNDGSYTYSYDSGSMSSIRIVESHEQSGKERILKGCVISEITVDTSVESVAQVTVRGAYADEEINDPASLTSQPTATDTYEPLTFAEGSVKVDGNVESYVQSMTLNLTNNVDLIREVGTRVAVDYNPKTLEPGVDLSELFEGDHEHLKEMYGGSAVTEVQESVENQVSVTMIFDNGKSAGSGINKAEFSITGTLTDSYDEGGIGDPTADLEETINRVGEDVSVDWTNEESSAA